MKKLIVPFTEVLTSATPIQHISDSLDKRDKNAIEKVPWPAYPYKPNASFVIAQNNKSLFIKFYVRETAVRAMYYKNNAPVYKDACVELFIAFNGEDNYYNFEFNCIGTCSAGYGTGRNDRKHLQDSVLASIKRLAMITPASNSSPDTEWQLTIMMPLSTFSEHDFTQLKGQSARANFFKCGDDLPEPHFLSWSNIVAPQPNFHLPEFFGEVQFE